MRMRTMTHSSLSLSRATPMALGPFPEQLAFTKELNCPVRSTSGTCTAQERFRRRTSNLTCPDKCDFASTASVQQFMVKVLSMRRTVLVVTLGCLMAHEVQSRAGDQMCKIEDAIAQVRTATLIRDKAQAAKQMADTIKRCRSEATQENIRSTRESFDGRGGHRSLLGCNGTGLHRSEGSVCDPAQKAPRRKRIASKARPLHLGYAWRSSASVAKTSAPACPQVGRSLGRVERSPDWRELVRRQPRSRYATSFHRSSFSSAGICVPVPMRMNSSRPSRRSPSCAPTSTPG